MKNIRKTLGLSVLILSLLFCFGLQTAHAGAIIDISDESYLMINYNMQFFGQYRDTGSGRDGTDSTSDAYFRRNRVLFFGKVNNTLKFYLQLENTGPRRIRNFDVSESSSSGFYVLDSYLIADFTDAFRLRVGKTKDPLTRHNNDGCFDFLSIDRPFFVYSPYQVSRDTGVVVWGNLANARLQYRLGVMEGRESADSPKDAFRYTGRIHLTLLDPEHSIHYRGSYLGKKKVLTFGAGYQYEPDVVYGNLAAKTLAKDYTAWTIDGFFEYPTRSGTFTLGSTYLDFSFDGAYKGADPDPTSVGILGERRGSITRAAYLFPQRLKGGIKVQLYGRYEDLNYAQYSGINGQELEITAGGVNFYVRGQKLRFSAEYANYDLKYEDPTVRDFYQITTLVQFMF